MDVPIKDESVNLEEAVNGLVIRYEETAWEFLKRLVGHKGQPMVADINTTGAPRVYAGLPQLQERPVEWEEEEIVRSIRPAVIYSWEAVKRASRRTTISATI